MTPSDQKDDLAALLRSSLHRTALLARVACTGEIRALLAEPRLRDPQRLEHAGYRVFSQNGEDGMLQEIFRRLGTASRRFVEFGVGAGLQCNSHYLLHLGWSGLWIERDAAAAAVIRRDFHGVIATGRLALRCDSVSPDNIDGLIREAGLAGEIDLLSIDIDGNDYHVCEAITAARPRVVVIEYNATFPPPAEWVMPYAAAARWDGSMVYGASLAALARLLAGKGFALVGTDLCGVNAFFVRDDLSAGFVAVGEVERLYNAPRYWLAAGLAAGHRVCVNPAWRAPVDEREG